MKNKFFVVLVLLLLNMSLSFAGNDSTGVTPPLTAKPGFANTFTLANGMTAVFCLAGCTMPTTNATCPANSSPAFNLSFAGPKYGTGSGYLDTQDNVIHMDIGNGASFTSSTDYSIKISGYYYKKQTTSAWIWVSWTIYCIPN